MAVKSSMKNMVVCLTSICLICAALLAGIYELTKNPIQDTEAKILKESIGKVLPKEGEISPSAKPIEVGGILSEYYTLTKNGEIIAYAIKSQTGGFGGPLILMVGLTKDGIIYNTAVLSQQETPGLGAKCDSDEKFISQWKGFDPKTKTLKVTKDGGSVDAITASTITSRAYTKAVENAFIAFNKLIKTGE